MGATGPREYRGTKDVVGRWQGGAEAKERERERGWGWVEGWTAAQRICQFDSVARNATHLEISYHTAPPFPYHPSVYQPSGLYPSTVPSFLPSLTHDAPRLPPSPPSPLGPLLARRPRLCQATRPFMVRLSVQSLSATPPAAIPSPRTDRG